MLPGNCLLTNELIANSRSVSDVLVGHDDGVDERHDGSAVRRQVGFLQFSHQQAEAVGLLLPRLAK